VLDSGDELFSSGNLDTLDFQEVLQVSRNGKYDVILGVDDETDGDTNDLVALVEIDRVSEPGGGDGGGDGDGGGHANCDDCGPDGEGITVVGTLGPDIIVGTNCDDLLRGRGGDDGISGRGGDDNIGGGRGKDQLVGGSGDDTFVFGSNTGRDVIRDFGNGDDLIDVSRLNIDFDDVKQRTNADGDTVITFEGFTGPNAPKIVLDGVGFLEVSDFIF
jgi:Ca2+-binding RTX toxin-like protein